MAKQGDAPPGGKVVLPEQRVEIARGFLRAYWGSREPLPKMQGVQVPLYFLQRGLQTIQSLPGSSAITVMTIAVSLFLLAGFLLILKNVGALLEETGTSQYLSAYLSASADSTDISRFIQELEGSRRVRSVQYISKEDALRILHRDLGSRSGFLAGLEKDNPLPASLDIVLNRIPGETDQAQSFVDNLRNNPLVDEVVFGSEWVAQMQGVIMVFRAFGFLSLIIALAIIAFLISNTIKLVIFSQKDEISIMQLVGASRAFVKIPFIIGGIMQGVVGSLVALILLKCAFMLLNSQLRGSVLFGIAFPELVFLNMSAVVMILLVGIIIGALGSFFALGRFMNV